MKHVRKLRSRVSFLLLQEAFLCVQGNINERREIIQESRETLKNISMKEGHLYLQNRDLLPNRVYTDMHSIFISESFHMLHLGIPKYIMY